MDHEITMLKKKKRGHELERELGGLYWHICKRERNREML